MSDGLSPEANTYPPEVLNAIGDLLATAHRHQVGVAFEPDGEVVGQGVFQSPPCPCEPNTLLLAGRAPKPEPAGEGRRC